GRRRRRSPLLTICLPPYGLDRFFTISLPTLTANRISREGREGRFQVEGRRTRVEGQAKAFGTQELKNGKFYHLFTFSLPELEKLKRLKWLLNLNTKNGLLSPTRPSKERKEKKTPTCAFNHLFTDIRT